MPRRLAAVLAGLALVAVGLSACGSGGSGDAARAASTGPTRPSLPPTTTTTLPTPTAPATTATTATPTFTSSVAAVTAADLGASWHDGCPVGPAQLRKVTLGYVDFDGVPHTGALVVNADVTDAVISVFRRLFEQRFPIRRMDPIDAFGASDDASMAADNTSAFNCRLAVTTGPAQWSVHAYGEAIDINPVENPYLENGQVLPPAGSAFVDRTNMRPGMAGPAAAVNDAFAAASWPWGGRWSDSPDYQHFSANGG